MSDQPQRPPPHVLIFPLPVQGPVKCMLKLAELLCLNHIDVTFVNTHNTHRRVFASTDAAAHYAKYPNLKFRTVPDGLPEENPRTADQLPELLESIEAVAVPAFREMVVGSSVSCLIADGIFAFAVDVAAEADVPLLYFDTVSPSGVWTYLALPNFIQQGHFPFKDDNLDELVTIPGMEGFMRRRDLPHFYRGNDLNVHIIQLILKEAKHLPLAQGLILNTFQELEAPILSELRNVCPNIYAIGPLHSLHKSRLQIKLGPNDDPSITTNSIWKEDRSCISWLDSQPSKSVLYVSIGSLAVISKDQLYELWHGLVNSGTRFLWVQRPGSILEMDTKFDVPLALSEGTKERGLIVSWAPQEEVLAHPAVGGFLTHSGWNSTLESMVEGKPMICWPYFVDQQPNSRYVGEVWKLGLDMKDSCDRGVVEKMIRELMESKKDEFLQRANDMANLARTSVDEGGSSFVALDRLIEDISCLRLYGKNKI